MSDNLLEKQLEEVRAELTTAKAENEAIKAQIEEAKDKEFASKVEAFEAEIQEKDSSIAELEESIKSTQARVAELEDALAKSQEELTSAKEHMEEMKKKEKMEKRKAALVEAGFDQDDVDAALAAFDGLADEAFDSVVAMYGKKEKAKKEAEAGMPPELKEAIEKKLMASVRDVSRIITKARTRDDEQSHKYGCMVEELIRNGYPASCVDIILKYAANNLWKD